MGVYMLEVLSGSQWFMAVHGGSQRFMAVHGGSRRFTVGSSRNKKKYFFRKFGENPKIFNKIGGRSLCVILFLSN